MGEEYTSLFESNRRAIKNCALSGESFLEKQTKIEDLEINFLKSIYACISPRKPLGTWRMQCISSGLKTTGLGPLQAAQINVAWGGRNIVFVEGS